MDARQNEVHFLVDMTRLGTMDFNKDRLSCGATEFKGLSSEHVYKQMPVGIQRKRKTLSHEMREQV